MKGIFLNLKKLLIWNGKAKRHRAIDYSAFKKGPGFTTCQEKDTEQQFV